MKKIQCCFAILVMAMSSQLFAGKDEYICTIVQIQVLHSSGNFNGLDSYLLGKSFSIDRDTGKVDGKPFSNGNYKEIQVLNRGSEKNGYNHIIILPSPNILIQYIYVREFVNGSRKPFWGTNDGDKIFSGTCK